jgi:proteasome accessory factor B
MVRRQLTRAPIERMLHIHEALQRGAVVNCTTLGRRLEVARKTLVRDITYMRDRLDLPIEFDAVHNTYRYTEPVENFPTVQVSEGEVFALLVAQKALEQYRGTPFHKQLSASFEKLSAGLKDTITFSPSDEMNTVSFKNVGVGRADAAVFGELSRGVVREVVVTFAYRKPGGAALERRRVRPYHLSHRQNLWYLVGFDIGRGALRTFAVPRISEVAVTDERFERPKDFSPEAFFAHALGVVAGDGRSYRVVVRFSAASADRVREREWHESQTLRAAANGGVELTLQLGALEEIERWILEWGAEAEVLQPPELRARVRATVAALAKIYATG